MGVVPRINAPTVKQHHENVESALVDAAERILREQGSSALTAGAVTASAGIARNSIYRYVDSVDDLRGMVLARHLPQWSRAVAEATDGITEPREIVRAWTHANLQQAAVSGHGWLMGAAQGIRLSEAQNRAMSEAHGRTADPLRGALAALVATADVSLAVDVVRAMVDAGFRRLDGGDDPERVTSSVTDAVMATVGAFARR